MTEKLTNEEVERLKEVQKTNLWDSIVQEILDKRDGQYPPDWYARVLANPEIDTTIRTYVFETLDDMKDFFSKR